MIPARSNPLAGFARQELERLRALAGPSPLDDLDATDLLAIRSRCQNLHFQAGRSPTGHCRFLAAADGPIAINLARDDDWAMLPAWLQGEPCPPSWDALAGAVGSKSRHELLQQGIELGLAVALPDERMDAPRHHAAAEAPSTASIRQRPPRVFDLSTLWAGPLCGQLLRLAGAQVIKWESATRPDGARSGHPEFWHHLNGGKFERTIDLTRRDAVTGFIDSLADVDIVIESARPRALPQLGIHPGEMLARWPHLTWVSITAYGRTPFGGMRIGYGDDAGIAAGLSAALYERTQTWDVVGDAIGDPLTGIHAAHRALAAYRSGGGGLVEASLCDSVRQAMRAAEQTLGHSGFTAQLETWRAGATC